MTDRNKKLDFEDVCRFVEENEVKLSIKRLGKRGTEPTIFLTVNGKSHTGLSKDATGPIATGIANLMVALGFHAKKNERPLDI